MRKLLHKKSVPEDNKTLLDLQNLNHVELSSDREFVKDLLKESLSKLDEEEQKGHTFTRWELGACWIQHLQDQKKSDKEKKLSSEKTKNEVKVEGLGTSLRSLKYKKNIVGSKDNLQPDNLSMTASDVNGEVDNVVLPSPTSQQEVNANENEVELRRLITDDAFTRLKESETGLHCKVFFFKFVVYFLQLRY